MLENVVDSDVKHLFEASACTGAHMYVCFEMNDEHSTSRATWGVVRNDNLPVGGRNCRLE
jgi:hypothetical protein